MGLQEALKEQRQAKDALPSQAMQKKNENEKKKKEKKNEKKGAD